MSSSLISIKIISVTICIFALKSFIDMSWGNSLLKETSTVRKSCQCYTGGIWKGCSSQNNPH
jgi:hypothetical protein